MCTYLNNMEGYKINDLKSKGFDSIQEMFDIAFKRYKKYKKVEDDKETTEIKELMEIIPDEEKVAIDAIPLAVKSPSIVDWKIHKEGRIRVDGKSQMYMIFSHMLKIFYREDLETLYKLEKSKYESTRLVEDLDLLLWGDLKTMFEPHIEDKVWRNQQDYKVLSWKLYDSCGVHSLRMQHVHIYMLVEKKYPLTPSTLSMMLEKKLMIDYESKMAYQLYDYLGRKQLDKENYLEHPIPAAPVADPGQKVPPQALAAHTAWVKGSKEIEEGQSVSLYVLNMKSYIDNLERLGQPVSLRLAVSLILISLSKEYDGFVQNYNMHSMGKTVNELHAMLNYMSKRCQIKMHLMLLNPRILQTQEVESCERRDRVTKAVSLRGNRKLKLGALNLYVGDGHRAAVEAIGEYHLCLPSGLVTKDDGNDGVEVLCVWSLV
ncbi:hypothetical protein Tco_0687913 [Tanacetum coccineum]